MPSNVTTTHYQLVIKLLRYNSCRYTCMPYGRFDNCYNVMAKAAICLSRLGIVVHRIARDLSFQCLRLTQLSLDLAEPSAFAERNSTTCLANKNFKARTCRKTKYTWTMYKMIQKTNDNVDCSFCCLAHISI